MCTSRSQSSRTSTRIALPSCRTSTLASSVSITPGFSGVLASAASRSSRGVMSPLSHAVRMSPSRASSIWARRPSWASSETGTLTESLRVSSPSLVRTSTRNPLIRWNSRDGARHADMASAKTTTTKRPRTMARVSLFIERKSPPSVANAFWRRKFARPRLRPGAPCGNFPAGAAPVRGCCGKLYASFHYRDVHRVRGLRDQVPDPHDHGRQEREIRHPPRPVHRLLGLRAVLPGLLHPGPEGRAGRKGQAEGDPQGHRGPGPLHGLRVLHRHLSLRLHLPDRGPPARDLPQNRRSRRRALRLVPPLRDRLREGRHLRPQPDHTGEEIPPRSVTETPRGPAPQIGRASCRER